MPNFLMLSESDTFPRREIKRFGGKNGGAPSTNFEAEMARQEAMMSRQMSEQQRYQRESEDRMRADRERERVAELERRTQLADKKEVNRIADERQEAALFQEITGQSDQSSDFGGGLNLDMPTIERPDYEQEDRPL